MPNTLRESHLSVKKIDKKCQLVVQWPIDAETYFLS